MCESVYTALLSPPLASAKRRRVNGAICTGRNTVRDYGQGRNVIDPRGLSVVVST